MPEDLVSHSRDKDQSRQSPHHTLGFRPNQSAPGDHHHLKSGTTAQRPTGATIILGYQYWDTTINKPIWSTGAGTWKDATGLVV